jgi:linearmycin/streptolysin S transport system ATP-binding protein
MIQVQELSKRFGNIEAVQRISFEVAEGEIYGLLGPNGAGKTTTLSMLSGLLAPDAGTVTIGGLDLAADPMGVKAMLGVVPQETALYEDLTGRENVRFWGGLYGVGGADLDRAVTRVLAHVGLEKTADRRVKTYSGGMKRRLNLSLGLVHGPRVVLLDEPTVGIDPQARLNILDVVREIAGAGTTVLYTTHYLEEAERLCDRIAIMDHGRILAEGTLEDLKQLVGEAEVVTVRGSFDQAGARKQLESLDGVVVVSGDEEGLVLSVGGGSASSARLLEALFGGGISVEGVSIQPPSLQGLFIKLTGRELRD